jgi:conjugal transfer pilus assembly protein TraW
MAVMKARLARIDWDAKKQQAKARFWQQQRFITLPRATQPRRRMIDPTITVTQDIQASDGTVIVRQGTQINPLEVRPFTQAVVVFDPLDKGQVAWLTKTIPQLKQRSGVQQLTFIATRFDREQGWDSYKHTLDAVNAPVYLLTPDVTERFGLAVTPSVITAQGKKRFIVEEGMR